MNVNKHHISKIIQFLSMYKQQKNEIQNQYERRPLKYF